MTIYYVKAEGGSDGAAGTSPAVAWATVQYADTQISAGDTVWLSPGPHRITGPEWTMQSSGSSGSPILWKGDFLGVEFDMPRGEVVLTDCKRPDNDSDTGFEWIVATNPHVLENTGLPTEVIQTNGSEWVELHNLHIMNISASNDSAYTLRFDDLSTSGAHYGWRVTECYLGGRTFANNDYIVYIAYEKNDGDVPDGSEVKFERNVIIGAGIYLLQDESPTVACDLKFTVQSNVFMGRGQNFYRIRGVDSTYQSGGWRLRNNTFAYTAYAPSTSSTGQALAHCYNNAFAGNANVYDIDNTDANWDCNYGMGASGTGGIHRAANRGQSEIIYAMGGQLDMVHRATYGWSPWLPFQPFVSGGLTGISAGANETADAPTYDLYGFPLDEACGIALFWADESYEAVDGPTWASPEKFYDEYNDQQCYDGAHDCGYITGAGLNNSDVGGFPTERYISLATDCHPGNGALGNGDSVISYLAETLYSGTNIWGATPAGRGAYEVYNADWTPPAGGWTMDVLTKLRMRMSLNNLGTSNAYGWIWTVACELYRSRAVGAVAGPAPLEQETTIVNTPGGSSGRIGAWGWWQKPMYLIAGSYTYTVYARFESEYTGTKPTLEIDVPESGANYTDTMTGAADQWEQLSVGFTLTEARTVVLRLRSYNTAQFGYAYFDDLEQS